MARVAALVVAVAVSMAACGSDSGDAQEAAATSAPANEAVEILSSLDLPLTEVRALEGPTGFMPDGDGLMANATAESPAGPVYLRVYGSEDERVEAVKARNLDNIQSGKKAFWVECGAMVLWLPRDEALFDAVAPDDLC